MFNQIKKKKSFKSTSEASIDMRKVLRLITKICIMVDTKWSLVIYRVSQSIGTYMKAMI